MQLNTSVAELKGVGEKTVKLLEKLNIRTVGDLIYDMPRGFMDIKEPIEPVREDVGRLISVRGTVVPGSVSIIKKGRVMIFAKMRVAHSELITSDDHADIISLVYFNAPYMKKTLETIADERIFYGVLSGARGLTLAQPAIFTPDAYAQMLKVMQPVYSLTKGISNNQLKKLIKTAFDNVILPDEYLSADELVSFNMPDMRQALIELHFPTDTDSHKRARRRIAFHEFLTFFIDTHDDTTVTRAFDKPMIPVADTERLIEALPYELTGAQRRTWSEIEEDMCGGTCMNRMVQGDVGSGKTIVAFLSLLLNTANGHQGVMMAPTEVLATQHYENLCRLCERYGLCIRPRLLIGAITGKRRTETLSDIESGQANVIIGTQAVITDKVVYKDLTLVITDEQHRFGVKQREALADKGGGNIHVLVMSATPIPRSLAMTLYAGIKLSVIDELPKGRLPVLNSVVGKASRPAAYKFIAKEVSAGHQAYVICPMIDEAEGLDLENVIDYAQTLKQVLPPGIRVSHLHGRMSLNEKSRLMDAFAVGDIDVLVSTTVIEVGIDVPNATVMMIENADRFGLAALHQIRGRVGRGDAQSYCIFINTSDSQDAKERLDVVGKSNDGFHIASEDLRLRGPGEITGIRQSGEFGFRFASIYDDYSILEDVREFADALYENSSDGRLSDIIGAIADYSPGGFMTDIMRTV